MTTKEQDHFAILLIGEDGVGKTAIGVRFLNDIYVGDYDPTIEEVYRKRCVVDEELALIELYDPGFQEDYRSNDRWNLCIRHNEGFILVYSIASRTTFEQIRVLHQNILRIKKQHPIPIVLVANWCDADHQRQVTSAEGSALAEEIGCRFFEASAKMGININEAIYEVVREIRKYCREPTITPGGASQIDTQQHSHGCCSACTVL